MLRPAGPVELRGRRRDLLSGCEQTVHSDAGLPIYADVRSVEIMQ